LKSRKKNYYFCAILQLHQNAAEAHPSFSGAGACIFLRFLAGGKLGLGSKLFWQCFTP
jgi:hypothetical protein